jgi:hypothetical protein
VQAYLDRRLSSILSRVKTTDPNEVMAAMGLEYRPSIERWNWCLEWFANAGGVLILRKLHSFEPKYEAFREECRKQVEVHLNQGSADPATYSLAVIHQLAPNFEEECMKEYAEFHAAWSKGYQWFRDKIIGFGKTRDAGLLDDPGIAIVVANIVMQMGAFSDEAKMLLDIQKPRQVIDAPGP